MKVVAPGDQSSWAPSPQSTSKSPLAVAPSRLKLHVQDDGIAAGTGVERER